MFHAGPHGVANVEVRQTGHVGSGHYSEVVLRVEGTQGGARNEVPTEGGVRCGRHPEISKALEGTQGAARIEVSPESGGFGDRRPEVLQGVEGNGYYCNLLIIYALVGGSLKWLLLIQREGRLIFECFDIPLESMPTMQIHKHTHH